MNSKSHVKGFTLMEVMITVAIIGVLAAIAYPSYREQVARSRRADAKATLLDAAQWVERQYTTTNRYDRYYDSAGALQTMATSVLSSAGLPAATGSISSYYTVSFGTAAAASAPWQNGFTLRMVPTGAMTGDRCGTFTVTNTGAASASGGTRAECWDK